MEAGQSGRPRLFASPEDMAAKIEDYFAQFDAGGAKDGKPPTMAGMAYFLGFEDRHALAVYETYDGFSATVKRARSRIEEDRAERLLAKDTFTPGVIFDLKNNHGWKDKTEQELSGPDGGPIPVTKVEWHVVKPSE